MLVSLRARAGHVQGGVEDSQKGQQLIPSSSIHRTLSSLSSHIKQHTADSLLWSYSQNFSAKAASIDHIQGILTNYVLIPPPPIDFCCFVNPLNQHLCSPHPFHPAQPPNSCPRWPPRRVQWRTMSLLVCSSPCTTSSISWTLLVPLRSCLLPFMTPRTPVWSSHPLHVYHLFAIQGLADSISLPL